MPIQRHGSIYGSYPYNKLGRLPNAENLRLNMPNNVCSPSQLTLDGLEDTTDNTARVHRQSVLSVPAPIAVGISPLERLFGIVKDNTNSMVNLIIVVIIVIVENLVKGNLFTCPCEKPQNMLYGAAFLAAPSAALFVVGIMANNTTWLLVTGCCYRAASDYPKQHHSRCYHVMGILARAFVAPLAWVIIGFIDGKFYQCAASEDPCGNRDRLFLASKSQVIGYVILMVSMFTAIFGMLLWRALRPLSYEQHHYIDIYRAMERLEIHRQFEEHAQGVARQNVRDFLANESRPKKDWDYIANVPSLTPTSVRPGGENSEPPSMSPLNKLVQRERRESMDKTALQGGTTGQQGGCVKKTVETQTSVELVPMEDIKKDTSTP